MSAQLGITGEGAIAVIIATTTIYLVLLLLVRMLGPRTLSPTSIHDVACLVALGAVVGRTTLLATPSLASGVLAVTTLVALQRLLGVVHRDRRWRHLVSREPVAVVVNGQIDPAGLRRVRLDDDELRQMLRLAGVGAPHEVRLAVLERNGQLSVVRGAEVDPWLLADVVLRR